MLLDMNMNFILTYNRYVESRLKQFHHAVHLCPFLSCPYLLHVCAILPPPRVLED